MKSHRWIVATLCAVAFALQLGPAVQNRFHPDEALYSAWALQIASGRDTLLFGAPVDKPPLSMYIMAASLWALGRGEIAARLPSLMAATLTVALAWRWAKALYPARSRAGEEGGGVVAALAMALSPFTIAFGGTAFLDPLMVTWGLAACVAASRSRLGWAGIFLGLSFATKVQGLLFTPLVVITAEFAKKLSEDSPPRHQGTKKSPKILGVPSAPLRAGLVPWWLLQRLCVIGLGFGVAAGLVIAWSLMRCGTPFWEQQAINYGGLRFAFAAELGPRLIGWLGFLPYFFGPMLGGIFVSGLIVLLIHVFTRGKGTSGAAIDLLLVAYMVGFFALHWLLAFPVWDRYLLLLVPVAAVLLDRSVAVMLGWLSSHSPNPGRPGRSSRASLRLTRADKTCQACAMVAAIGLIALPFALQAARSEIPIGGDHGPHDGIDRVAAYLRELPVGTVVYDHWLSWEFDYYLWEAPLYRAYFDTPADLARDLRVFGRSSTRYIVVPASESRGKIERAVADAGFRIAPVMKSADRLGRTAFVVYRTVPRE
ncbi:MAG TPA: glycosyltransferase family 39 protein [Anaerolineae bacterium]|nr:glycosyltransferase family 39 protein [Anaerolineae bacterium]